jgi:DNA polymerase I
MDKLSQFSRVIAIDFEYRSEAEFGNVHPVCMVAEDLITGQTWTAWLDDGGPMPELPTGDDVLYVSSSAPAEWSCYLPLGIELPSNILDLYAWHRLSKNGWKAPKQGKKLDPKTGERILLKAKAAPLKCSLLQLMDENGLAQLAMDAESKAGMRDLIQRVGPYTEAEKQSILDYCAWDVRDLKLLMPKIVARPDCCRSGQRILNLNSSVGRIL